MNYIIWPGETVELDQLGGKAGALGALSQQGFLIPAWFVLSPGAFYASLDETQHALLAGADENSLARLFEDLALSEAVQQALYEALARLCPKGEAVAVRSSALDEDGQSHSFAGQLESFLNVPPQAVARKVVAVWRSGYSERLLAYRRSHGLEAAPRPPAVLIQRMVQSALSGVAFSADPVTGDREAVVVAAVPGLGAALVSGEIDGDSYRIDRQGHIVDRYPALGNDERRTESGKQPAHGQVGVNGYQKPILNPRSLMSDFQIQRVADLARQVDQFFGGPQDIEWAMEGEQLYLLQARPVTALSKGQSLNVQTLKVLETFRVSDQPEDMLNLWDNSNIAESYPGVTTPLTFSFARRAYEEVYRQFCRMMGVPAQMIAGEASTFRRMLGLRQGQIYYNLLSWYRVLALLPGYKLNRRFMEQMMGVKEPLPDELLDQQAPPSRADRWRDGLYLLRTLLGLLLNYVLLPRWIKAFYARFNQALGSERPDLSQARPEALVAYYRALEDQLLTRWDAPLINDFFAMIFYGLLRKLTESWCGDTQGTLQNSLLTQTGDIISAEPARRISTLAHQAAVAPDLVALLCQGSRAEITAGLPRYPEFSTQYRAYLDKFGERCLEELKLESPTLHDDPLLLLRSIGQLARTGAGEQGGKGDGEMGKWGVGGQRDGANQPPITNHQLPITTLHHAEQRVGTALAGRPLRRLIFGWVLGNARQLIRNRENLRFERTRLFGRARLIFVELGDRFSRLGLLDEPRDIFYLEVEEALGLVEGVASTADLKGLVAVRKAEFDHYRTLPPLPNRFETRGIPIQRPPRSQMKFGNNENPKSKIQNPKSMRGLGCSPGRIRGPVRVVTDPKAAQLRPGEILIAQRTDPGWILLFPAAAGLLVEYGSLLSHSAIVSRELGLPAIVGLAGLTHWLKDGDWVEFDGSTGVVTRIEPLHASG